MKALLIVPYFGEFPTYFPLFLETCKYNPQINWLFFTDNEINYETPENTSFILSSFTEIREKFRRKLGREIVLERPHKLCDYKVTYGFVFSEYITDYDYWGHCDIDVINGNLEKYVFPLMEKGYEKIFSLGHFSLYKNCPSINSLFQKTYNGERIDEIVFSDDKGFAFDEWHCPLGSINHIAEEHEIKFFRENPCANLESRTKEFALSIYNFETSEYDVHKGVKQLFTWEKGTLLRHSIDNGRIEIIEHPYVHFHRRNLRNELSQQKKIVIIPNKIVDWNGDPVSIDFIKKNSNKDIINFQYLKVKYINFRYLVKQFLKKNLPAKIKNIK